MGNKKTAINGIGTTGVYKDGDCMMLKNLRQKNGRLVPVAPRKTVKTLGNGYTYLFYHNLPQTGENLLGVRNGNIYLIGDSTETLLTSTTGFKSMTQIGNLVNVLDGDGVRVLWWSDDHYNILGAGMDMCPVKVDLQSDILRTDGIREVHSYYTDKITNDIDDKPAAILELARKAIALEHENGYTTGYYMACIAVELFDGNWTLHSQPVLIGASGDKYNRYEGLIFTSQNNINVGPFSYKNPVTYPYAISFDILKYVSYVSDDTEKKVKTAKYDKAYAHYANDVSGSGNDPKTFDYPSLYGEYWSDQFAGKPLYLHCTPSKLKFKIDTNISSEYSSLIKSISVFITPPVEPYIYEKSKMQIGIVDWSFTGHSSEAGFVWYLKHKELPDILTELKANQYFYKVHEITFDELRTLKPNKCIDIDLKDKLGDNLLAQDRLHVDNYTHHVLLSNGQMVYNSKLHIWDNKQLLFKGWPLEIMKSNQGEGQFFDNNPIDTLTNTGYYTIVRLKTSNGISEVVRYHGIDTVEKFMIGAMISYPDSRAFEMEIVYITAKNSHGGAWVRGKTSKKYQLTASDTHNFSYYIQPDLKPFYAVDFTSFIFPEDVSAPTEVNKQLIYRNELKISSTNNPLYFPSEQTHTVGTGVILNAGTNAMRMSDGQFGQYPLYVFTTEGITSLDTGTTVAYNRQSSASLEIPVNTMICPTPFGVLFIGKRGLYVINGQQVQYLSAAIEENMLSNNIVTGWTNWEEWVSGLRLIAYDYQQHEIVLAGAAYNLIYNVDAKQWYISTEQVDGLVENTGSELKMYKGMDIKDFSQMEQTETSVELVTRPMTYESDERKNLLRMMLRGRMYNMTSSGQFVQVYGSNDGVNHTLLRAFTMPEARQGRDHKDLDFGAFARATYRNYVLRLVATIDEGSSIDYVESEVTDRWVNDKDR